MNIETFENNLHKVAEKFDPNFKALHNPPFLPYYRTTTKPCVEYINYFFDNFEKVNLISRKDQFHVQFIASPFKYLKGDISKIKFLFNQVKNSDNKDYIFSILNIISCMVTKDNFKEIKLILDYKFTNLIDSISYFDNNKEYSYNPRLSVKSHLLKPLGKTKHNQAKQILLEALEYSELSLEALDGLKYFKSEDLIPYLQNLIDKQVAKPKDKDIIKKAKKLLESINNMSPQHKNFFRPNKR